jgi:hypothetical protein
MSKRDKKRMTAGQSRALRGLRGNIERTDIRGGDREVKGWVVTMRGAEVVVESRVGHPAHPFDDIERKVWIEPDGSLRGYGNRGHGIAGRTRTHRGPGLLYEIDAERIY